MTTIYILTALLIINLICVILALRFIINVKPYYYTEEYRDSKMPNKKLEKGKWILDK